MSFNQPINQAQRSTATTPVTRFIGQSELPQLLTQFYRRDSCNNSNSWGNVAIRVYTLSKWKISPESRQTPRVGHLTITPTVSAQIARSLFCWKCLSISNRSSLTDLSSTMAHWAGVQLSGSPLAGTPSPRSGPSRTPEYSWSSTGRCKHQRWPQGDPGRGKEL